MATILHDEIKANFEAFEIQWPNELTTAMTALAETKKHFFSSYLRISSIQAWRISVIAEVADEDSAAFFFEAQNDLLISHCLARCGSFRQALKSIRSGIENILFALYYKDHPIELAKWGLGQHKIGFTELTKYFEGHPKIQGKNLEDTGLDILKNEYSTLSRAVHGSAKTFRMTRNLMDIRLWSADASGVGQWAAREKTVINALNFLLLHIFQENLSGAKNRGLRENLGLVIPTGKHASIKTKLKVSIVSG